MTNKVTLNGQVHDADAVIALMDGEIREELHFAATDWASEQEFLDTYCALHAAKYGEDFVVN